MAVTFRYVLEITKLAFIMFLKCFKNLHNITYVFCASSIVYHFLLLWQRRSFVGFQRKFNWDKHCNIYSDRYTFPSRLLHHMLNSTVNNGISLWFKNQIFILLMNSALTITLKMKPVLGLISLSIKLFLGCGRDIGWCRVCNPIFNCYENSASVNPIWQGIFFFCICHSLYFLPLLKFKDFFF